MTVDGEIEVYRHVNCKTNPALAEPSAHRRPDATQRMQNASVASLHDVELNLEPSSDESHWGTRLGRLGGALAH